MDLFIEFLGFFSYLFVFVAITLRIGGGDTTNQDYTYGDRTEGDKLTDGSAKAGRDITYGLTGNDVNDLLNNVTDKFTKVNLSSLDSILDLSNNSLRTFSDLNMRNAINNDNSLASVVSLANKTAYVPQTQPKVSAFGGINNFTAGLGILVGIILLISLKK